MLWSARIFMGCRHPLATTKTSLKAIGFDDSSKALVGRLLRDHLRPYVGTILAALLCGALVAVATGAFTQLIKPIIDDIFGRKDASLLWPIALATLLVFCVKGLSTYGQGILMSRVGHRIVADLQALLYARLVGLDLAFYDRTSPGSLIARFIDDITLLRSAATNAFTGVGKDSLTALVLGGVMFYEDWLLALVALFAFPTAILPIAMLGRRMRKVSGARQAEMGRLTTLLDETFQGIRHVKAYGMEDYEVGRARERVDRVFRLNMKAEHTRNLMHPIMETLGGLAVVAVILYGGQQVISDTKAAGSFFAFIIALLLAYEPIKRLTRLHVRIQEGLAAAERVFRLIDQEPRIVERPEAGALVVSGGTLRFERVSFTYESEDSGARAAALQDIDLVVPSGQTVALVGASGAGKSTVLNLIPRFYEPESGAITIDGQDLREVTLASLRAEIALVSQEILLFDDTLRANIAYGRPDANQGEIEAAAEAAGIHDFIDDLPEGYDTQVGPRGARLSGGQRQRVAIARAMLKNAPILLLDEATSSLDSETERQVQRALKILMTGRTTLVIAHRLSTVIDADVIYVMEQGRVVEQGTHGQLLAGVGPYARLHALQFAAGGEAGQASGAAGEDLRARA
jgi:subfamily B ATP-binding cassette protein MsbA